MRIYRGKVEPAALEILDRLIKENLVEVDPAEIDEARKDLESVLLEYMRMHREINEAAKDMADKRGLDYSALGRIRRNLAKERNFGMDDEGLDYIIEQMIEIMFSSGHVDEVWGEDHVLNKAIAPILKKHMNITEEVDKEVRKQIKNLEDAEGTVSWEVEYQQKKDKLERLKKLK